MRMCELGSMPQGISCLTGAGLLLQPPWEIPTSSNSVPETLHVETEQRKADQVAKVGRPARRDWVWDPPSRPLGRPAVVPCSPFGRWHPKWREAELGCLLATASWLNTFRPLLKVFRPGKPLAALPPDRVHGTVKALWPQCRGRCHHGPAGRGGQQRQRDPVPRGRASRSPPPQE